MSDLAQALTQKMARLTKNAKKSRGTIYRSVSPTYATSDDLLTGEGSCQFGGRWNPVSVAAIYGSMTPETAMTETLAHAYYYQLPVHSAMPRTFVAIDYSLSRVLDFTDGTNRKRLGISESRMLKCDWRCEIKQEQKPVTQALGEAAHELGLEAIIASSAADRGGMNLVVFPDNLQDSSKLTVVSEGKL